ncbi:MAG TPA: DUF3147 family protein [Terracidiphilus sp.]|nr:DUF3147 family protein [Terracidiphilus sp.]
MLSSPAGEMIARFVIGGVLVSIFSVIAEIVRPKSFAGLFGAAPSIALTTMGIAIAQHGRDYAAIEARSMVLGAIAFFIYASVASWLLMRFKTRALTATVGLLPLWLGVSVALWFFALR